MLHRVSTLHRTSPPSADFVARNRGPVRFSDRILNDDGVLGEEGVVLPVTDTVALAAALEHAQAACDALGANDALGKLMADVLQKAVRRLQPSDSQGVNGLPSRNRRRDISFSWRCCCCFCACVCCAQPGPPAPCSVTRLRRSESLRVFTASREQLLYVHADTRRPGH